MTAIGLKQEEIEFERLTPGSLADTMSFKMRLAQILAFRTFEERLQSYGRAPRYLGLLGVIRHNPGQVQSRLAEAVAVRRSSLVAILDQLEADGLVRREASTEDRRAKGVWLTEKGEEVFDKLVLEAEAEEKALSAGIDEADLETAGRVMSHIITNLMRREEQGGA